MLDEQVNVLRLLQGMGDSLVADIAAEDFCKQPVAGMNHPAWILGHLVFVCDRFASFVGVEPRVADWQSMFGKGSTPIDDASHYPAKDQLLEAWHEANDRLIAAVQAATPEQLAQPNQYARSEALPTLADVLSYIMTAHTALHVGQLSAWRRADGRPPQG